MKNLYIVDYWVPFPSSEYGGVISVIAESDDECFDILSAAAKEWSEEDHNQYNNLIMAKVAKASRFELANEDEECGIVDAFTT
jgi:hypothetical protein